MRENFFDKNHLVIFLILIMSASSSFAMYFLPPANARVNTGLLAIATNFTGYVAHAMLGEQKPSDVQRAGIFGLRVTWFAANLHLLRSLVSNNSLSAVAKRGAVLNSACFLSNTIGHFFDAKLEPRENEGKSWSILKKGCRGALWTTGILANLAIFYETIVGK